MIIAGYSLRDARNGEELQLDLLTSLSAQLHQLLETASSRGVNDLPWQGVPPITVFPSNHQSSLWLLLHLPL